MSLGYDRPLYLLPFDHRHSYVIGMFKFKPTLTTDEHGAVVDSKQVIYDGSGKRSGAACRCPAPASWWTTNSAPAFSTMRPRTAT